MASLKLIAERVNASPATVSRALNDHPEVEAGTRRRVLRAAKELGYERSSARRTDTAIIGLMQTSTSGLHEYDALLMRGLIQATAEYRFNVVWLNLFKDKLAGETYGTFLRRKGVKGVVLRAFGDSRDVVEEIADEGVEAVVIGEKFDRPDIHWLRISGLVESRRAIEHLLCLGHRRIALVVHDRPTGDHADREQGYVQALRAAGIEVDENLIVRNRPAIEAGATAINRLLSLPSPPTAVYVTDPPATLGAIRRCHELGIGIPAELSVVGFDDDATRLGTWPQYSAVCQATTRLGFDAGRWLARRLAGLDSSPLQAEYQAHFEVLRSTGVPPAEPTRVLPDGQRLGVTPPAD